MTNTEIPEEAYNAAERAYTAARSKDLASGPAAFRAGLTAALPALRKQWAEDVVEAIRRHPVADRAPREFIDGLGAAAHIVREYGETTP